MTDLVSAASALARAHLDTQDLASRWLHVQAVGRRADELALAVAGPEQESLCAAAWLHDIGYARGLVDTGMHSIDGANYLRRHGWPERIVALVAHHTGARFEAEERGLRWNLAGFAPDESAVMDALVTADLTTGPDGRPMAFDDRIAEILHRYPPSHPVHRAIRTARPLLEAQVARTLERLTSAADF